MRIQCENCRTIFNLDETLLNQGGSRVRCSLCGRIFMAYPPAREEEDMAENVLVTAPPPEMEAIDQLILVGNEEAPRDVLGRDEDFEQDLASVYRDIGEPGPDAERRETGAFEETADDRTTGRGRESAPQDKEIEPLGKAGSQKKPKKGGLRTVLLAILLALLVGVAAVTYWKPEWVQPYVSLLKPPEKEKPADAGVRLLQFESVAGSFVDSEKSGQLFVIRGMVKNQYPKPRSYLLIKGSILDNKGKVVESRVAYAGNTFTEEELKALPMEEVLKALQNRDGMARQNVNVSSGATIPFIIVFDNLSDNLSEFAVEAVSSSPGN
ncbi:MAG: zinc-ribbon domain-containing protein [Deltaproteobacteria bacterium]|nr:zinc-ribbon domain-containing protein [Deltaproteobacteria bacterium]